MGHTIVIVEDDREFGDLIRSRLHRAGYQPALINDSEKAFPFLKEKQPDLAILDVMMPKMNGFELCRRVRRDPLIFTTPVLMLSALGGEPEIAHALEQGADDYLVKPFDIGVLFAKIKLLLEKQARIMQKSARTGFYGGEYIKRLITNKLLREELMAVCYFSLTHYAPYVKVYGPEKRDEAVRLLADIFKEVTKDTGVYECAISHLGGPDFMVLLSVKDFERYCSEVVSRFKHKRNVLFSGTDLNRGKITVDVSGEGAADCPLMSVAVGVVTNETIKFRESAQVVKVAGEVNKRAQAQVSNGNIEIVRQGILL